MKATKQGSTDRRVRRTRRLLRDSLVALTLERGWEDVSILDVCSHADVGRSTFYLHFADKEDLLLSGFDELHEALQGHMGGAPGQFAFVEALLEHVRDNAPLMRAVVGRKSGQAIQRRFRDLVTTMTDAELTALGVDAANRPLLARYVSGGFVDLLLGWLEAPRSMEPSVLSERFRVMTRGAISASQQSSGRR
jgi:AcrR family transcriptional regulator